MKSVGPWCRTASQFIDPWVVLSRAIKPLFESLCLLGIELKSARHAC